jgi:SAM-dependent methyltransferase
VSTIRPPFADDAFEFVVAGIVLCFLPDAKCASKELATVLRQRGLQVVGELDRHSLWAAKRR